ncbi:hypothetical protein P8H27_08730 [Pseudomonas sp. sp1636]|uniref:hypothetical protein n=1 Tax=Pseudomonas sp. sp1636 TaxID=3036707 RepID=UPI0025A55D47|nr:hypothetical protein [Pseudomonas sp. sp1636]MDM8348986.1 hypothetical protein [Pseudomonas sp. sp1636]
MATEMQLQLMASLLRRGRTLDWLSAGLTLLALLIGLAPLLNTAAHPLSALLCALLVILGLIEKYWAVRVALDAELFQHLGDSVAQLHGRTLDLDRALGQLGLQPANQAARAWDQRCRGALRLLRMQAVWLLAQLLLAVLIMLSLPWLSITG